MPILFGVIIAARCVVGWFTITLKAPAARTNLLADLPVEAKPQTSGVRSSGQAAALRADRSRQSMERDLAQAGIPMGSTCPGCWASRRCSSSYCPAASWSGHPLFALLGRSAGFFAPRFWISNQRTKRQEAITAAVSDTIDQLTICVESGLGFDAALCVLHRRTRGRWRPSCSTPSATCGPVCPGTRRCGRWPIVRSSPRSRR